MFEIFAIVALVLLVAPLARVERARFLEALRDARRIRDRRALADGMAGATGLELVQPRQRSPFQPTAGYPTFDLLGTRQGREVRISWAVGPDDSTWTEISVHGAPADLDLHLPLAALGQEPPLLGPDIEDPVLLAALGAEARDRLERARSAGARRARLADGALHWKVPGHLDAAGPVDDLIATGLVLLDTLCPPPPRDDVADRLAHQARHDPHPGHRRRCLRALIEHHPAAADVVARSALEDPEGEVRLLAALHLEDAPTLARFATEADAPSAQRIRALRGLYASGTEARRALRALVASPRPRLRMAALEAVVALEATDLIPHLRGVERGPRGRWDGASYDEDGVVFEEVALALAQALTRLGDPAATPLLVDLLSIDDVDIRRAALQALGAVGTSAAVPHIQPWTGPGRLALGGTARQAVAAIQARVEHAEAGALSLADDEGGGLSLAEDEPGALSLARGPDEGETAR